MTRKQPSIRLTSFIRDQVAKNVRERFDKEWEQLLKEEGEFGIQLYKELYPEWKKMNSLPEGWLVTDSYLHVHVHGKRHQFKMSEKKAFPASYSDRHLNASPHMAKQIQEQVAKVEAFKARRTRAVEQARAVLNSVTTLAKLLEVWPEVKQLLPKELTKPPTTALALPIASLNELIGLKA